MYEIEAQEMSGEFFPIWQAAGEHLNKCADSGLKYWLRSHPNPPYLEHLSFRLGNQLFFIRVEDADKRIEGPGGYKGLSMIATKSSGHACVLPMKKSGISWVPAQPGWGLLDAATRKLINPVALISDEQIEMTTWEVHDLAVQNVRERLVAEGFKLMSWQVNPDVDPAIWFVGRSKGPEWVVVRAVKFPKNEAQRPSNWDAIKNQCARMSSIGHFASVALVSAEQPFENQNEAVIPLWRGHPMYIRFDGVQ